MHLLRIFPDLGKGYFRVTSPATHIYNCIAWAAEDDERWWWPDGMGIGYWTRAVPREVTLEAFKAAYNQIGYEECASPEFEDGWQKIAIFVSHSGIPTHAARQLRNDVWTSKCGPQEDIEHNLDSLEGALYGRAVCFMRRSVLVNEP